MTDAEIINRVLSGNKQAFSLLVAAYQTKALTLARSIVHDEHLAEDLVQDSFVKAFTSLASFKGGSAFSTWFYRIVYTTGLNALQKSRRTPISVELIEDDTPHWIEPYIFDQIDDHILNEIIREEMTNMSPTYSAVMDLFYGQECSYDQIVAITGMPLGTIKTRLNRGRALLRNAIVRRCPELEIPHV